jgi:hypothetical protein
MWRRIKFARMQEVYTRVAVKFVDHVSQQHVQDAGDVLRALAQVTSRYSGLSKEERKGVMVRVLEEVAAGKDGVLGTSDDLIPQPVLASMRVLINSDVVPSLLDMLLELTGASALASVGYCIFDALLACVPYWRCCCCCSSRREDTLDVHDGTLTRGLLAEKTERREQEDPMPVEESVIRRVVDIRPTQLSVGMQEVQRKCRKVLELSKKKRELDAYLSSHKVPVVLGLGGHHFAVDHHHLLLALHTAGVPKVPVEVVADLTAAGFDDFWQRMEEAGYLWPYDDEGRRLSLMELVVSLPGSVVGLRDDPYRSLAGIIRKRGAFKKDLAPFAEFHWANFLRGRVAVERDGGKDGGKKDQKAIGWATKHEKSDRREVTEAHVSEALKLAASDDARHLPGFAGPGSGLLLTP